MDILAKWFFTSIIVFIASMLSIKITPDGAPDWIAGIEVSFAILSMVGALVFAIISIWSK